MSEKGKKKRKRLFLPVVPFSLPAFSMAPPQASTVIAGDGASAGGDEGGAGEWLIDLCKGFSSLLSSGGDGDHDDDKR